MSKSENGALFLSNVEYNAKLAPIRAKPKIKNICIKKHYTPDEVLNVLKSRGVNISRRTLLNYQKWHLIPQADKTNEGRGTGVVIRYPESTPAEAFIAHKLIRTGLKPIDVAVVRDIAYEQTFRLEDDHHYNVIMSLYAISWLILNKLYKMHLPLDYVYLKYQSSGNMNLDLRNTERIPSPRENSYTYILFDGKGNCCVDYKDVNSGEFIRKSIAY